MENICSRIKIQADNNLIAPFNKEPLKTHMRQYREKVKCEMCLDYFSGQRVLNTHFSETLDLLTEKFNYLILIINYHNFLFAPVKDMRARMLITKRS